MSLLIYLTAFLFQLPLNPSNKLTIESISVIFGPAILAPRDSANDRPAQDGLRWLLSNWDDSLSQDLLDEEYDPLESPVIQYSPQKMAVVQVNSPAFSMAASPMVADQPSEPGHSSASDRSPIPEGWGEAISPMEDDAILQQQQLNSRARKSSFNLDPDISDNGPLLPVATGDVEPVKERSVRSTTSSRSLRDLKDGQPQVHPTTSMPSVRQPAPAEEIGATATETDGKRASRLQSRKEVLLNEEGRQSSNSSKSWPQLSESAFLCTDGLIILAFGYGRPASYDASSDFCQCASRPPLVLLPLLTTSFASLLPRRISARSQCRAPLRKSRRTLHE